MILPTLTQERKLWRKGYRFVAGVDEVGRGAWAGPVVAAAVIFPPDIKLPKDLRDSKLLQPEKRRELSEIIQELALSFAIGEVRVQIVNKYGVASATQRAMRAALRKLSPAPEYELIDAFYLRYLRKSEQIAIVRGDKTCASIAAASILAKVYRDKQMAGKMHRRFPKYRFCSHKGYGTPEHQEAIFRWGLTKIHRIKFVPQNLIASPCFNESYH
ncbi:MAG: ribonuclease HII [Candidatus Cloacimonetes bacterium]|nr:ribonuclease HII [Candidatus Cloacimonadota bacterium]